METTGRNLRWVSGRRLCWRRATEARNYTERWRSMILPADGDDVVSSSSLYRPEHSPMGEKGIILRPPLGTVGRGNAGQEKCLHICRFEGTEAFDYRFRSQQGKSLGTSPGFAGVWNPTGKIICGSGSFDELLHPFLFRSRPSAPPTFQTDQLCGGRCRAQQFSCLVV